MSGTLIDGPQNADDNLESKQNVGPDLSVLEDHTPVAVRAPRALAGLVLTVGLVFLFFCSRPIWHTDVWGHLSYGRTIWARGTIPSTEPLMPLAKGVQFIDTAWLSQLIGYGTAVRLGVAGLQGLTGFCVAASCALLAWRAYRTSRNGWFGLFSVITFLALAWMNVAVLRPQMAGMVCFIAILTYCTSRKPRGWDWLAVPGLFAVWANLHGSFMVGLGLLGCFAAGRALDVVRRTGSVKRALADDRFRRFFLLMELSAAAVLLNPYGIGLYTEVLRFSSYDNLQDLTEWMPLTLRDGQTSLMAVFGILLAMCYRVSPRRVQSWEVLSLVVFGWSALWSTRMSVWVAPIMSVILTMHAYAIWRARYHKSIIPEPAVRTGKWTVVTVGVIWICFAYSTLGMKVLHGKQPKLSSGVSADTPVAAVEYLKKNPPKGLIFNSYEWGDFLIWNGPPGLKVFVNSHAHLVPRDVWSAYMMVAELRNGWEEALDRYGINTIVVDMTFREPLIKRLKEDEKWKLAFEQDGQVIFTRKKPIE